MTFNFYFQLLIIVVLTTLSEVICLSHEKPSNTKVNENENHNKSSSRCKALWTIFFNCLVGKDAPFCSKSSFGDWSPTSKMANSSTVKTPAMELCDKFFQWRLKENPEFATMVGIHDYDDKLDSWSLEAFAKRSVDIENFMTEVTELLQTNLTDKDYLNLKLLKDDLELVIEGLKYKGYVYPINFLEGVQTDFDRTVGWMQYKCEEDYQKLLSRYKNFPTQVDELIAVMKLGIEEKKVPHMKSMDGVLKQFSLLQVDPKDSAFYSPFKTMPEHINSIKKEKLRNEGKRCIEITLLPAFKKLEHFIDKVYIPSLRPDIAVSSLPNGSKYYKQCLHFHLSLPLTAKEVHDQGLQEVTRIKKSLEKIKTDVGFNGTLEKFYEHLRTSKEFYFTNKEDIMEEYRKLEFKKITPKLLSYFSHIPEMELKIEDIPPSKANFTAAYYLAGAYDGSRPGVFYVNTNYLDQRPKYDMAALALHEGLPGHHLQASYGMEQKDIPAFRQLLEDRRYAEVPSRFPMNTAYIEGWGLYSEYLGEEMGIFTDPYSLVGRYSYEIFRACRLVVDTGIHIFGWSFYQAVDYFKKNTALSMENIKTEVRRYITWPGQACSYKIGEMKIKELRKLAHDSLGEKFDIRDFHDVILKNSAIPLTILEELVQDYINQNR